MLRGAYLSKLECGSQRFGDIKDTGDVGRGNFSDGMTEDSVGLHAPELPEVGMEDVHDRGDGRRRGSRVDAEACAAERT